MMKTHIYDFTPEELEEIRRADAEIERRESMRKHGIETGRDTSNCGGDRRNNKRHEFERINRLGNPVWEYRVKHNITQRELAKRMYTTQETVSSWERGKCKIPAYALTWLQEHDKEVV